MVQRAMKLFAALLKMRALLLLHEALARRVAELERRSDQQARAIMSSIKELESPKPVPAKRQIGFRKE